MDRSSWLRMMAACVLASPIWFVFLIKLGGWLHSTTATQTPEAPPVEMQMVQLAPPALAAPVTRSLRQPAARVVAHKATEPPGQTQAPVSARPSPREAAPHATESPLAAQSHAQAAPHSPPSAPDSPSSQPAAASASEAGASNSSAHAIEQPLPTLPDDLRDASYQTVATARFVIHADGTIEVELIRPTPNPRLNQLLLDALRRWRFAPATQAGHPVESRQDVRVHFNVD